MEYKEAYWNPEPEASRFYRLWQPGVRPRAAAVIIHGYGEHGGRYGEIAEALVHEDAAVFVPDLYGHGHSAGTRAFNPGTEILVDEIHAFLLNTVLPAFDTGEEMPLFLMGHSMGGGLALLYALRHQELLSGLILSGSAVLLGGSGSRRQRLAARLAAALAPRLPLIPFDETGISRIPEVVHGYMNDPLVYKGKMRAKTAYELLRFQTLISPELLETLELPVLIYHGGSDSIVPPASSEHLYRHIGSKDTIYELFPEAFHEVHREPEKEQLFGLLRNWLDRHCGG
jgi:alpha-beta hydrolase superfamily lysophospholipase